MSEREKFHDVHELCDAAVEREKPVIGICEDGIVYKAFPSRRYVAINKEARKEPTE